MKIVAAVVILAAAALYFAGQRTNPPGFYRDEASVAYNAATIARHGVDQYGERFPLFFRAFGEYKNPTYIYALAAVFRVAELGNLLARRVAAVAGFIAALLMALLAWQMTYHRGIAAITFLTALFTPALFEISRLAFEVCCFPLVLALFLLSACAASRHERWSAGIVAALASTLVLITLTYSVGRLLAPMLLAGLLLLLTPSRRAGFLAVTVLYALAGILPLILFQQAHDGALAGRFLNLTYAGDSSPVEIAVQFVRHFADNLVPIGDANPRHHVAGSGGSVLLMTIVLAIAGAWFAVRERDRWLLFLLYGTLCAVVPASLTTDRHHALRLVAYPVFLIALSIVAMQRIRSRPAFAALVILGIVQSAFFLVQFHRHGGERVNDFDGGARPVVNALLDTGHRPIYLEDGPTYALAWWYALQRGVDRSEFDIIRAGGTVPPRSLFMGTADCDRCTIMVRSGAYRGYRTAAEPSNVRSGPSR